MFAPQWYPDHALGTEVVTVELPKTQKLVDYRFLRRDARKLWNIAWIIGHADRIEIKTNAERCKKQNIAEGG